MRQLEVTLALLKSDRIHLWTFHEVISDNNPD